MSHSELVFHRNPCACGARDGSALFEAADYNFGTTTAVASILRCRECGSLYPECFPDQDTLGAAYANYYTANTSRRGLASLLLQASRRAYLDREAPARGTILDYGCGSGAYLNRLARTRSPSDLYGSDAYPATTGGAFTWLAMDELAGRKFRHITLSHVLEHVPDPAALFHELAGLLEDGGTLWIATPNADSVLIETFGPHARDVDFPRHRAVLSRGLMEKLAHDAGLTLTWQRSPLLNTVMNGIHGARNLWRDPKNSTPARAAMVGRVAGEALKWSWPLSSRRRRRAPEMVALCRNVSSAA
jgi:2-polyprenyl-3-methyl-5-hydroxy-6-metoxy-1,4-benzoquinol methylase